MCEESVSCWDWDTPGAGGLGRMRPGVLGEIKGTCFYPTALPSGHSLGAGNWTPDRHLKQRNTRFP